MPLSNQPQLTPRQNQILRLLAQGADNRAIGQELGISYQTVKNHIYVLYRTLGVTSRVQAALKAHDILEPQQ